MPLHQVILRPQAVDWFQHVQTCTQSKRCWTLAVVAGGSIDQVLTNLFSAMEVGGQQKTLNVSSAYNALTSYLSTPSPTGPPSDIFHLL